jgi:flagellar hook assembly protein FlgD
MIALATSSSDDGLSITTDKDDYQPGDTVWFTGAGWPANDTLDILLEDEPATHEPHTWWVPVDETGGFRDSTYVVDVGDLGVTFTLTATSRATGRSLTVVFTDGNLQIRSGGNAPTPNPFSPNADAVKDEVAITLRNAGSGNVTNVFVRIRVGTGTVATSALVREFSQGTINQNTDVIRNWDGKNTGGTVQPDGNYTARIFIIDNTPPVISVPVASPNSVQSGLATPVTLTATATDPQATNVAASNYKITSAQYKIDGGSFSNMAAVDGSFSSRIENLTVTVPGATIAGLSPGNHLFCVRATDDVGNQSSDNVSGNTNCATLSIGAAAQTITFPVVGPFTFGDQATFQVAATATSGLTVSFATQTAGKCTVLGTTVTIVEAGTCTVRASQAGNGTFSPAPNVDQDITINRADQTIAFPAVDPVTFGDPPFAVAATATSGLTVSFATETPTKCTVLGTTVTIVEAGTCTIRASQAGNVNYSAAAPVDRDITINKAPTTTAVVSSDLSMVYGEPVTFTATVGSTASGLSGTVTFKDGSDVLGTGTLGCAGTCTAQFTTGVEDLVAGTHSITAVYGGNTNFLPSPSAAISQVVSRAGTSTAITSSPLTATYGDVNVALQATVTANSPSQATVKEGTVVFTVKQGLTVKGTVSDAVSNGAASANFPLFGIDAGSYTVDADYQPASSAPNFLASSDPTPEALTVSPAETTTLITSVDGAPFIVNGNVTVNFSVAPKYAGSYASDPSGTVQVKKAPSALQCSATLPDSGCSFTAASIGDYSLTANYGGDGNFLSSVSEEPAVITVKYFFDGFFAPVDRPNTMNLSKAGQAIPLKWRLTDANGVGITDLVAVAVKAVGLNCASSAIIDQIETYAAGSSGLQNLGNGNYQYNWKTLTSYLNTCKSIALVFGAGGESYTETPSAFFTFRK